MKQFLFIPLCLFFFLSAEAQSPNCVWAKRFFDGDIGSSTGQFAVDAEHNVIMINNRGWQEVIDSTLPYYHVWGSFIVKYDSIGHLKWSRRIISDTQTYQYEVKIYSVKTDADNNIYAYGIFTGSVFIENQTLSSSGASDILLIKYDKNGNLLWAKKMGSQLDDRTAYDGLRVSKEGTIFISGKYAGYFNIINPTPDTIVTTFDTLSITTYDSILTYSFVACFNTHGTVRWVKSLPSGSKKAGVSLPNVGILFLDLDKYNNVYVSGAADTGIYWDNIQLQQFSNQGFTKNFLLKCDSNGNGIYSKSIINKNIYVDNYVTVDGECNLYLLSTQAIDTVFIDGVSSVINGCYLIKYNSTGNLVWVKKYGTLTQGNFFSTGIVADVDNNPIISFQPAVKKFVLEVDTLNLQYAGGIFLVKVNRNTGKSAWIKPACDSPGVFVSYIVPDDQNNFFIAGAFGNDTLCLDNQCLKGWGSNYSLFLAKFHQYPTGIESIPINENTLTLYPNPAHQTVTINRAIKEPNQLRVIDALGRIVPVNYYVNGKNTEINIASLPVGMYMVLVNDGNDVATAKLVKE